MPRFSANLGFLWTELPLLERIDAAAQAGFKAVELHWPYDVPAEDVRAACEHHGVALLGVNTAVGDASAGDFGLGAIPGRECDFQAAVDQSIVYCRAAGARAIHAMAGVVAPDRKVKAREVLLANLIVASEKAATVGLMLLLEPINSRDKPDYFYSTVGEAAAVIKDVGRRNVKILFDVYHVGVAEGDIITKLRRYFAMIGHVQIAAVPSRAEPDEGEIAYTAIFAELDRLCYDGWVGCEYRPRVGTQAGLGWLATLGARL